MKDDPQEVENYVDIQEADNRGNKKYFQINIRNREKNKLLIKMLRLILSWMLGEMNSNV